MITVKSVQYVTNTQEDINLMSEDMEKRLNEGEKIIVALPRYDGVLVVYEGKSLSATEQQMRHMFMSRGL